MPRVPRPIVISESDVLPGNKQDTARTEMRRLWSRYLALFAFFLVLGCVIYPFDFWLSNLVRGIHTWPGDFRRLLALSELVAHGTGVATILVLIWCLVPHQRIHIPRIAACGFVAGLVATGLKLLHARTRPLACPPQVQEVASTWQGWFPSSSDSLSQSYDYALQSFPSAHTATAVGFAVGLIWLYPRGRYMFIFLAALAGLQRIAFLAHWPSDVIFGAAVGVFFGACFVLPGTLGNHVFNRLEWHLGLGKQLDTIAIKVNGNEPRKIDDGSKKAA